MQRQALHPTAPATLQWRLIKRIALDWIFTAGHAGSLWTQRPPSSPPLQGMVCVVDPKTSWCAKWLHLRCARQLNKGVASGRPCLAGNAAKHALCWPLAAS